MANEKFKINGVVSEVVPIVGTTGDILKKTGSGVEWGALAKATQTQDGLLSKEDFNKLADIEEGAEVNTVTSVNGQTGAIITPNTTYDAATTSSNGLMTSTDKVKLNGIETGAQKNSVTSVQGRSGAVVISKFDVGLDSVNNVAITSEQVTKLNGIETGAQKNNVTSTDIANWNNKVDKVNGKQLSTNDYTTTEKNKLAGIEAGAQKNTITSVQGRTGAVTISKSDVGLSNVNNVAITAAQVNKVNELNYTKTLTQAQYDALSPTEKNRTDVWYGIYKE